MISENIKQLTQLERQKAFDNATEAVRKSYGKEPAIEAYHVGRVQLTWVDKLIWGLSLLALGASFLLSAMRMYHIGYNTFLHSIDDHNSALSAGIAIVILAEMTQLISALAMARVHGRTFKMVLLAVGAGSTLLAITGNLQVVQPWAFAGASADLQFNPFAWLEALLPPIFVLCIAHVLKHQLLDALQMQLQAKQNYANALAEYRLQISSDATAHANWKQFYANALKDALVKLHNRSNAGKLALAELTNADWRLLVHKEMQADEWFADAESKKQVASVQTLSAGANENMQLQSENVAHAQPEMQNLNVHNANTHVHVVEDVSAYPKQMQRAKVKRTNAGGGNATGEVDIAVANAHTDANGIVHSNCPRCNRAFANTSVVGAKRALSAHFRKCEVQTANANVDDTQPMQIATVNN